MAVKGMGVLGLCCVREMKALTVKMETVTLIDKGRYKLMCFIYFVYGTNSKIFFLSRCFILWGGIVSDLDKYIFPSQT